MSWISKPNIKTELIKHLEDEDIKGSNLPGFFKEKAVL